jgi:hypothetical protein
VLPVRDRELGGLGAGDGHGGDGVVVDVPAADRAAGELLELVVIDALPADAGEARS